MEDWSKMKKKILLIMLFALVALSLTGCINTTYEIGVNSDGTFNASYAISPITADDKGKFDPDVLEALKNGFEDAGYEVSVNDENGQESVIVSKDYVTINANEKVNLDGVQINPMHYISNGAKLTRGFMKNIIEVDADIDLSALNSENTDLLNRYEQTIKENLENPEAENTEDTGAEISEEEKEALLTEKLNAEKKLYLEQYLPQMNIKLTLKTNGKILNTNSTAVSSDGKSATWLLIPGTVNNVVFECTTGFDKAFLGTAVILIISLFIALFLVIYLVKFYGKQFKNQEKQE